MTVCLRWEANTCTVPWRRSRTVPLPRSPDPCHILPAPRTTSCPRQTVRPPSPVICITAKTQNRSSVFALHSGKQQRRQLCKINHFSRSPIFSRPYGAMTCGGAWNNRWYPAMPLWCWNTVQTCRPVVAVTRQLHNPQVLLHIRGNTECAHLRMAHSSLNLRLIWDAKSRVGSKWLGEVLVSKSSHRINTSGQQAHKNLYGGLFLLLLPHSSLPFLKRLECTC